MGKVNKKPILAQWLKESYNNKYFKYDTYYSNNDLFDRFTSSNDYSFLNLSLKGFTTLFNRVEKHFNWIECKLNRANKDKSYKYIFYRSNTRSASNKNKRRSNITETSRRQRRKIQLQTTIQPPFDTDITNEPAEENIEATTVPG